MLQNLRAQYVKGPGRLLRGGLPSALASALLLVLPIAGRGFLSDSDYAVWALASTVLTMSLIFDFGGPLLATSLAARGQATRQNLRVANMMTLSGSLALGAVALLAWPVLSAVGSVASNSLTNYLLLVGMVVGSCLRSLVAVHAAVALGRREYMARGTLLLGSALLQVLLTLLFLKAGLGVLSLPAALLVSALCALTVAVQRRCADDTGEAISLRTAFGSYGSTRAVATGVGLTVTQLDRWVLAINAAPTYLATYDLAVRFAVLPRLLLLAVTAGLVAEAASQGKEAPDRVLTLLVRTTKAAAILTGLAAALLVVALLLAARSGVSLLDEQFFLLFAVLLAAHGLNGLTAPGTLILAGTGSPQLELRYLLPCFAVVATGYALALLSGEPNLVVAAVVIGLGTASTYFLLRQKRFVQEALRRMATR